MKAHRLVFATALVAVTFGLPGLGLAKDAVPDYVTAAVNDPGRSFDDVARDADRKPAAMVAFSMMKRGDVVVDFVPGGGYYTRIFAKLVGPSGRVYGIAPMRAGYRDLEQMIAENAKSEREGKQARPTPHASILALQNISEYRNVTAMLEMLWQYDGQFSVPEQADIVWTSDNYHDLHNPGAGIADMMPAVLQAIYASLKPGGYFVVIDHASAPGAGFSVTNTLHRADPEAVKAEVMGAGFVLDGQSNALANPADGHTKPVFQMHDKTDQFAFRFKKTDDASAETKRPPHGAMDGYYGNTAHSGIDAPVQRWVFYRPDGTYLELGEPGAEDEDRGDDVQQGLWYWDAAGHNCMLHQFPNAERGFIVCHSTGTFKKAGEQWQQPSNGRMRTFTIEAGRHYPPPYEKNPFAVDE